MRNKIIPYNPHLNELARKLRNNSTLAEVLLWKRIKNRALGVQFHRQIPMLKYIVDFYCHEIMLAIEVDGATHKTTYEEDRQREIALEKEGVHFIRFTNEEILNDMFNVILAIEDKVRTLLGSTTPL